MVRRLLAGVPLRVRLVIVACSAAAAGAVVMGMACSQAARGGLMSQADQQLRAYAGQLTSHPFTALPNGFGTGAGSGEFVLEVVAADQLMIVTGGDGSPGPALARIPARIGQLAVVAASRGAGSWLVVAQPVHFSAHHIMFTYGPDGYFLRVTSTSLPGMDGTLVVGLNLGHVRQAIAEVTVGVVVVSGAAILVLAFAGLAVNRAILRPVARAEAVAAGVVAHGLARQATGDHPDLLARGLAHSLDGLLSRLDDARMSAAAAGWTSEQMRRGLADGCRELRRPVSIVRGCAEHCRLREPVSARQLDRMIGRIADEAARIDAIIDQLAGTVSDQPQPSHRPPGTG
jgi:signal transduction histidine kinase